MLGVLFLLFVVDFEMMMFVVFVLLFGVKKCLMIVEFVL